MSKYNVAVVGATGAVGKEMLSILEERNFPVNDVKLLASSRSAGKSLEFKGQDIVIEEATPESFKNIHVAFFSAGGSTSKQLGPEAVKRGCVVIDNSSAFRMNDDVPLVVPEVNADDLKEHNGIVANPNCSTIIMVVPLKPLYDLCPIQRIVVSTYQAVSGAGAKGMEELESQVKAYVRGEEIESNVLPVASLNTHYQIAFNVIPQVDVFAKGGYTKEEWKMVNETQKMFHNEDIKITCTTVRLPVFRSHSESVNIQFENKVTRQQVIEALEKAPGVSIVDDIDNMKYPMPLDVSGKDDVYVGRIREDNSIDTGMNLWIVGDQIRKGAALNAIQIGECLLKEELL